MRFNFPPADRGPDYGGYRPYDDDGWTSVLRRIGWRRCALALGALATVVAIGVFALSDGDDQSPAYGQKEPPLVKAEDQPIKEQPDSPGGMDIPNRERLIYDHLRGAEDPSRVERILPGPEQPLPPPAAATGSMTEGGAPPSYYGPSDEAEPQDESAVAEPSREAAPAPPAPSLTPNQPAPRSASAATASPAVPPKPPTAPAATPMSSGAYQVQLVAVHSREQAEGAWQRLRKQHSDLLGNLKSDIVRAERGTQGVVYRLRAGPIDGETKARAMCSQLTSRKTDCVVIRPSG